MILDHRFSTKTFFHSLRLKSVIADVSKFRSEEKMTYKIDRFYL